MGFRCGVYAYKKALVPGVPAANKLAERSATFESMGPQYPNSFRKVVLVILKMVCRKQRLRQLINEINQPMSSNYFTDQCHELTE